MIGRRRARCGGRGTAVVCLLLGWAGGAAAATPEERFEQAAGAYERAEYAAAEAEYRTLLDGGTRSPEIYYNLGNTLFRQGRIGAAILSYERALRLDPADPDTHHNLEFCRGRIADRDEPAQDWLAAAYQAWTRAVGADGEAWLLLAVYLPGMAGLSLWCLTGDLRARRAARFATLVLLGLSLPLAALLVVRAGGGRASPPAVVLAERVEGRSGPGEDHATLFTVHEGLKVQIRNQSGDWVQILLPNGLNGWVPAAAIEKV